MVPHTDRSTLRLARKAGDMTRDGRGRVAGMWPILHYGFRPFFFLAALYAGLAIPLWLWLLFYGGALPGPFADLQWHAHEMTFGYLGAVLAGFILTAIPNWTGRLPLSGWPLAGLVALWIAGRLAMAFLPDPLLAMIFDLALPMVLALTVWREVVAGRNWKNAPIAAMMTLVGIASAFDHLGVMGVMPEGLGLRLGLAVTAMLIALVGGRIVPSFTRNWLAKQKVDNLPSSFGRLDTVALAATAMGGLAWVAWPDSIFTGVLLIVAGVLLGARLARWRGFATGREPIILVLHLGYAWLALALALIGAAVLVPALPPSAALHALTAGAIGTMTLAVMTRASLGHTGRPIVADGAMLAIYGLVTLGAIIRMAAPFSGGAYVMCLIVGGAIWSMAFLLFVARFTSILWGERVRG